MRTNRFVIFLQISRRTTYSFHKLKKLRGRTISFFKIEGLFGTAGGVTTFFYLHGNALVMCTTTLAARRVQAVAVSLFLFLLASLFFCWDDEYGSLCTLFQMRNLPYIHVN